MNVEDGLKTSELGPLQTRLDPIQTTVVQEDEEFSSRGAPAVVDSDDFHVTEDYVERLLGDDADKVLDRFRDRLERSKLPEFRLVDKLHKVAAKVLSRIQERLAEFSGEDDHDSTKIRELLKGLDKDLRKAFQQSFKLLHKAGILHDQGNRSLEQIREQLLEGLEFLTPKPPVRGDAVELLTLQAAGEAGIAAERSFDLEIVTLEGDVVTLEVQSEVRRSASFSFSADSRSISFRQEQTVSSQQELSFSVVGDLNDEEQAAIQALISRTTDLSNTFYGGNLAEAFEQAGNLSFDPDQIAGLSLELEQSFEARVAVSYQEVAALAEPEGSEQQAEVSPLDSLRALSRFVSDARSLTRLPSIAGLFADVAGLVNGLLAGALEIHPDHDNAGTTADTSPLLNLEELLGLTSPLEKQL